MARKLMINLSSIGCTLFHTNFVQYLIRNDSMMMKSMKNWPKIIKIWQKQIVTFETCTSNTSNDTFVLKMAKFIPINTKCPSVNNWKSNSQILDSSLYGIFISWVQVTKGACPFQKLENKRIISPIAIKTLQWTTDPLRNENSGFFMKWKIVKECPEMHIPTTLFQKKYEFFPSSCISAYIVFEVYIYTMTTSFLPLMFRIHFLNFWYSLFYPITKITRSHCIL